MIQNNLHLIERGLENLPWVDWTPTITAAVGTFTTTTVNQARYRKMGQILHYHLDITCDTIGTAAGDIRVSQPPGINFNLTPLGAGRERTRTGDLLQCLALNTIGFIIWGYGNTMPASVDGDTVVCSGVVLVDE